MSDDPLLPVYRAIKARLKTTGPQAFEYIPSTDEWPAYTMMGPNVEPQGATDELVIITFDVILMVSAALDEHQLKLIPYQSPHGPKSVAQAFRTEPTLGGLVGHARAERSRSLNYEEQAGYQGFGAIFEIRVMIG